MNAERLREAAALMRQRAATAEPGTWKLWGMSVMADPKGTSNVEDAIDVAVTYTPSTSERVLHTGNATHIASWQPAVALAVADMLDAAASNLNGGRPCSSAALAVADAYLGGGR